MIKPRWLVRAWRGSGRARKFFWADSGDKILSLNGLQTHSVYKILLSLNLTARILSEEDLAVDAAESPESRSLICCTESTSKPYCAPIEEIDCKVRRDSIRFEINGLDVPMRRRALDKAREPLG